MTVYRWGCGGRTGPQTLLPRRLVPAPLSVDQGQPAGLPKPGPFYRGSCPPPLLSDLGRDPVQRSHGPALGPRRVVEVALRPSGCSRQAGINSWDTFRQPPHHQITARGERVPGGSPETLACWALARRCPLWTALPSQADSRLSPRS